VVAMAVKVMCKYSYSFWMQLKSSFPSLSYNYN